MKIEHDFKGQHWSLLMEKFVNDKTGEPYTMNGKEVVEVSTGFGGDMVFFPVDDLIAFLQNVIKELQ